MVRIVEVVPHKPAWAHQFALESQQLQSAMADNLILIHHIGSTAIPHIHAKPIIDLLAEVADIQSIEASTQSLESLGYEAMGEFGIAGRRYFRKHNAAGQRTHHLHVFQSGSPEITRHLCFRDYMIAHPAAAQAYSELKQTLAAAHPTDIEAYMDGKHGFIQAIEQKALRWSQM